MSLRAVAAGMLVLAAACASDAYSRHADRRSPLEAAVNCARSADEALAYGRIEEAESLLREAIDIDPNFVRARRRLQDLQISTFRREEALTEAARALELHPNSPQAHYLMARVRDGAARRRHLERALELDPWYGWARLGLAADREAFTAPGAGLSYAREAAALLPGEADPLLTVLRCSRNAGETRGLESLILEGCTRFPDEPDFAEIAIRSLILEGGGSSLAAAAARAMVEERAEDLLRQPSIALALAEAVRRSLPQASRDRLEESLARVRARGPYSLELEAAHARLRAAIAWSSGRAAESHGALERAYQLGERNPTFLRELRLARIQDHDYAGAVRFERTMLEEFRDSLDAPVAPEEGSLFVAADRAASFPRDGAAIVAFARAAAAAGWIDESTELCEHAAILGYSAADFAEFRNKVAGFRRFLTRIRSELQRKERVSLSLTAAMQPLRELGRESLGYDPVEGSRVLDYFPMGYLLDGVPRSRGLPQLMNGYSYEIRLGKRLWGPVEAFALRRVASRTVSGKLLGRAYEGREVLGEGSSLFTQLETLGARFAGSTLPGSVFLVLDPISDAARNLQALSSTLDQPGAPWKRQRLPLAATREERTASDESFDLPRRLMLKALERDRFGLSGRMLANVRNHEYGHLTDAEQFLPLLTNVHHVIAWLFSSGFSPAEIEARLEMRAELVSMCVSPDPEFSLAEVVRAAERPAESPPHSRGFAELARRLVLEVDRRMELGELPALERDRPILPQLWKLSSEELRSVALAVAAREGLVHAP